MSARTVGRFNEAAEKDGRTTVVTWCPSCHMHMSDIMAPGNTVAFDITHISELLVASIDRLAPLLTVPVSRRVLLHRQVADAMEVFTAREVEAAERRKAIRALVAEQVEQKFNVSAEQSFAIYDLVTDMVEKLNVQY